MLKPLKQIRAVKKDHRKGRVGEDKCLDGSILGFTVKIRGNEYAV
jgi:hypothetical protein